MQEGHTWALSTQHKMEQKEIHLLKGGMKDLMRKITSQLYIL